MNMFTEQPTVFAFMGAGWRLAFLFGWILFA